MLEKQRGELLESIAGDVTMLRDLEDKSLNLLQKSEGMFCAYGCFCKSVFLKILPSLYSKIWQKTFGLTWDKSVQIFLDAFLNNYKMRTINEV